MGNRAIITDEAKKIAVYLHWNGGMEFHAHSLRRYYANCMYNAGVPLQDMSVAMRHANVSTTMRYLNIGQQNVVAALQRTFAGTTA